jgi:hypothetical protein
MKKNNCILCLIFFVLGFYTEGVAQVAINTDGTAPSPKAMLDVQSTTKGTHITRMTTAQLNAIAPAASEVGLLVFDLDKNRLFMFDGQNWLPFALTNPLETPLTNRVASDCAEYAHFGSSVSIDGDYAIVGANGPFGNSGAAYIFFRSGNNWVEQAKLTASDGTANDLFGISVSISGDYAIVGASQGDISNNSNVGSAYIFVRNNSTWTQQAKLTASDGADGDEFGISVCISSDYAIIGAPSKSFARGAAYIFHRTNSNWAQQPKIQAYDAAVADFFGRSVSIADGYAVVGSPYDDIGSNVDYVDQGSAYIYLVGTSASTLSAKITATGGAGADNFGYSVSISKTSVNLVLVGAPNVMASGRRIGAVYIFKRIGFIWPQQAVLIASNNEVGDQFGFNVSLSSGYAIVGAPGHNSNQGAVYNYAANATGSLWTQIQNATYNLAPTSTDKIGQAVGITPTSFIVGNEVGFSPTTGIKTGAAYFGTIDF